MADTPAAPGSYQPANPVPSQLPQTVTGNQSTPQPPQIMAAYQPVDSNFSPKQYEYQPMPAAPPSYYAGQAPPSQQSGANVVVVQQQPTVPQVGIYAPRRPVGDHYLIFSIIMTILAVMCFCCNFYVLLCAIPALVLSIMAQEDDKNGFLDSARARAKISLGLNITAVVLVVLTWLLIIIGFIVGFVLNVAIATSRAV